MSRDYDPRRSRPRPISAPDPEAAPVEALFGPEPAEDADAAAESVVSPSGAPRPVPGPRAGAPSFVWQLAPLMALMAMIGALVWWLTRRRDR